MTDSHNIFVSHRHEDDAKVGDLVDLLKGRRVVIKDSSITTDNPNNAKNEDYIKAAVLAPRIQWAGKIVVIITPDTANHPWVDWEVEYANKCGGKQIIGVWAPGSEGCDPPEALANHADSIVNWDAEKIVDALNGNHSWTNPDGSTRAPQAISRIGC